MADCGATTTAPVCTLSGCPVSTSGWEALATRLLRPTGRITRATPVSFERGRRLTTRHHAQPDRSVLDVLQALQGASAVPTRRAAPSGHADLQVQPARSETERCPGRRALL